jgi:hypothetical protein
MKENFSKTMVTCLAIVAFSGGAYVIGNGVLSSVSDYVNSVAVKAQIANENSIEPTAIAQIVKKLGAVLK